jgi:hypothetical protein
MSLFSLSWLELTIEEIKGRIGQSLIKLYYIENNINMNLQILTILLILGTNVTVAQTILKQRNDSSTTALQLSESSFKLSDEQLTNKHRLLRYYILTGFNEKKKHIKGPLNFSSEINAMSGTNRIFWNNTSIQDILTHGSVMKNRIILEVKNPMSYRYESAYGDYGLWQQNYAKCLEILLPIGIINLNSLDKIVADIFNTKVNKENKIVNVWILRRLSDIAKFRSLKEPIIDSTKSGDLKTLSMKQFINILNTKSETPIIDETGYSNDLNLKIDIKKLDDPNNLKEELRKLDLVLAPEKREIEMIIIKDSDKL